MLAAATERDVFVGEAVDVELIGIVEDFFVTVGRNVPHDDLVALLDFLVTDDRVIHCGATEVVHRRRPTKDFFNCLIDLPVDVTGERSVLIWVLHESPHAP